MLLFQLSKENPAIAKAELETILNKKVTLKENYAFCSTNKKDFSRLAMTNLALKIIGSAKNIEGLADIQYNKHYEGNYYASALNAGLKNSKIADIIWKRLKKPKTSMKDPKTHFILLKINHTYYMTKKLWENKEKFSKRKSHLRPAPHTASLPPKLARALVNLTGIKKGKILDPFCGSGGILIEAGLMGFKVEGYDIDEKMIRKADINLKHYNIKNYKLQLKDALNIPKTSYVVSDLPYGQSTILDKDLYEKFLEKLQKKLIKRAVLVFNQKYDYKKDLKKYHLKIVAGFTWYVHKSMTRKIIIVET